jgi:hypothetical protein
MRSIEELVRALMRTQKEMSSGKNGESARVMFQHFEHALRFALGEEDNALAVLIRNPRLRVNDPEKN